MSSDFNDIFGMFGGSGRGSNRSGPNNRSPRRRPTPPSFSFHMGPGAITVVVLVVVAVVIGVASNLWTEVLWFNQIGFERVLWTQWLSMAGLFVIGLVVAYAILMANVLVAYAKRPERAPASMRLYREAFTKNHKVIAHLIPLVIGVIGGLSLAPKWRSILVALNGKSFGKKDPQFGLDISFFTFKLPVIDVFLSFLLGMTVVSLIAAGLTYYVMGSIWWDKRLFVRRPARIHLGILAAIVCVLLGIRYLLDRWMMVYSVSSPTDGAMYTAVHSQIPARLILAIIAFAIAVLFLVASFKGSWYLPIAGIAVMVVSALVIGLGYPFVIQRFRVKPNEMELESPYIQKNINATLDAFGMSDLEYKNYTARTDATAGQLREDSASTSQIRLLDPDIISPTVRQMQQSRQYYTFPDQFAVDRYTLKNENGQEEKRDTVIAVRDINLDGLSASQRNWVNDHTVYTHGFGVVASYGNHLNADGLPDYWEQSIPSQGEMGEYEPRVYFSTHSPQYSIVGAEKGTKTHQELDYPDDQKESGQVRGTFTGDGGPSVGNVWNKLLYAIKFRSWDLFFSGQVNSHSQILYDRNPALRVAKVAPYLTLENRAYPAVVDMDGKASTPKRLVWIIDGYTTSNSYPYSEHVNLDEATADSRTKDTEVFSSQSNVNYMRNSVKAVVDAYDGSVTLYRWDKNDPVLKTWESIYPGQVKPMSEISGDLMSHMRYPEDLFKVQRQLLADYHVRSAPQFYTGGDQWRLSEDPTETGRRGDSRNDRLQPPYYLTMKMPSQSSAEFSLTSVYVPGGESRRAAMAGFLAVDSETGNEKGKVRPGYGKLRMIALPSSTTVPGPGQVQNNFNSNSRVNQELNLQDQQGSDVLRGNLLTLPVGGGLLYVQPVYIQSTGSTTYPQLRNVLVAFGDSIGFAPTLEEALDQVFEGNSAATIASSGSAATKDEDATPQNQPEQGAREQLSAALSDAAQAMKDSNEAMTKGDWAAYGDAQKRLSEAVNRAQEAQQGLQD